MAAKQNILQAITQVAREAAKAAIMAIREADNPASNATPVTVRPRTGGLALKQIYDWKAKDKKDKNYKTLRWR